MTKNKPTISNLDLLFPPEIVRAKIKTLWFKIKLCKCPSYKIQTQTWKNMFMLASIPWQNVLFHYLTTITRTLKSFLLAGKKS